MPKTKIEWLKGKDGSSGYSINPIKGLCQGGCTLPDGREYCYYSGEQGIAKRFHLDSELRLDLSAFDKLPKKPCKVFLCSTNDLYGQWISPEWRELILKKVKQYPQHTFIILTKEPQRIIDGMLPTNCWIGTSVESAENLERIHKLRRAIFWINRITIVSFEPLLGEVFAEGKHCFLLNGINWVIVGRVTGFGHKYDPKPDHIQKIVYMAKVQEIPVFLKDNLSKIWREKLIQEWPGKEVKQ